MKRGSDDSLIATKRGNPGFSCPPGFSLAIRGVRGDNDNPLAEHAASKESPHARRGIDSGVPDTVWVSARRVLNPQGILVASSNGNSTDAFVSGNGQFVAFSSMATNFVVDMNGDDNGSRRDIFRVDVNSSPPGDPELVSVDNNGAQSMISSFAGFFTDGGRVINDTGDRIVFRGEPCDWDALAACATGINCLCPDPDNDCSAPGCNGFDQIYLRDLGSVPMKTFRINEDVPD